MALVFDIIIYFCLLTSVEFKRSVTLLGTLTFEMGASVNENQYVVGHIMGHGCLVD